MSFLVPPPSSGKGPFSRHSIFCRHLLVNNSVHAPPPPLPPLPPPPTSPSNEPTADVALSLGETDLEIQWDHDVSPSDMMEIQYDSQVFWSQSKETFSMVFYLIIEYDYAEADLI